jgi:hypothetical protein
MSKLKSMVRSAKTIDKGSNVIIMDSLVHPNHFSSDCFYLPISMNT